MGAKIDLYALGTQGVDTTTSPVHGEDGVLASAQNAVPAGRNEKGALTKRDGLTALNSAALAGSVLGIINVALTLPTVRTFYFGVNQDTTGAYQWITSTDTFTNTTNSLIPPAAMQSFRTSPSVGISLTAGHTITGDTFKLYYPANVAESTSGSLNDSGIDPAIRTWDGTIDKEILRIPKNPTITTPAMYVFDTLLSGTILYVIVHDTIAVATIRSRVLRIDTTTFAVTQVGERFGPDTGDLGGGTIFALCMTLHQGFLYLGAGEGTINQGATGKIYRIRPTIDSNWTLDTTFDAKESTYTLASYKGRLFAGNGYSFDLGGAGRIMVRSGIGAWTLSNSTTGNRNGQWSGMSVLGENLYAAAFNKDSIANNTGTINKYDNTSWSVVYTVDSQPINPKRGTISFVHNNRIYFLSGLSEGSLTEVDHSSNGTSWTAKTVSAVGLTALGVVIT